MTSLEALEKLIEYLGSQSAVAEKLGLPRKTPMKRGGQIASPKIGREVLRLYAQFFDQASSEAPHPPQSTVEAVEPATPSATASFISKRSITTSKRQQGHDYTVMEGLINGFTEVQLFYRKFVAEGADKTIIVVHGLGEHSGRYMNLVNHFAGKGVDFYMMDNRGHGRSGGERGHILLFGQYLDDLRIFVEMVREERPNNDVFLLGHSMGGNIVANYLIQRDSYFTGAVLSAPGFKIAAKVPKAKEMAGNLMSSVWPDLTLPSGLNAEHLSRDPKVVQEYEEDPMVHDSVSARWFTQFVWAGQFAVKNADFIKCPVLVLQGGADLIVAPQGAQDFYNQLKAPESALHIFEGFYHEIFNDLDKETPLSVAEAWIEDRALARQHGQYALRP